MSVLKYKDPVTGEVKKVGSPLVDTYSKQEIDEKFTKFTYGTEELTEGVSPLEDGKFYFVYE